MAEPKNLIFWGAGATADLGMRTTKQQAELIRYLSGTKDGDKPLDRRIALAFPRNGTDRERRALSDLIKILGDSDSAYDSIHHIDAEQIDAMRQNWEVGSNDEELRRRNAEALRPRRG